jgi:transposase
MNAEIENEVVRRWRQGASQRRIARELKISRDSVQRILGRHERQRDAGGLALSPSGASRGSILDAYLARIEALVARWPQITAVRVYEELCKEGYGGGYSLVRDRLRAMRPAGSREPVVRFETGPAVHYVKQSAMCSRGRFRTRAGYFN